MTKQKISNILQTAFELLCFIGCLALIKFLKEDIRKIIPFLFLPFLFTYLTNNFFAQKIAFGIALTFLAYCTATVIITFYLTDFLYDKFIKEEHSLWDILAFLLPVALAIWTLIWSCTKRIVKPKYEVAYLISLFIVLFVWSYIV